MAQLGNAISRYHKLLELEEYRNPVWAEQLQERMRRFHLTESGRLLAPVLRPHFISRKQLDTVTAATTHLAQILDQMGGGGGNRIQLLPRRSCSTACRCCRPKKCWQPSPAAIRVAT